MCCRYEERQCKAERNVSFLTTSIRFLFPVPFSLLKTSPFRNHILSVGLSVLSLRCCTPSFSLNPSLSSSPHPPLLLSQLKKTAKAFLNGSALCKILESKPKTKWTILDLLSSYPGSWKFPFSPQMTPNLS